MAAPAAMLSDTIAENGDTLIITSAEVVLREIELKALETADCDVDPEPAGCEDIEFGPVLVDLPLDPGAEQRFEVDLPAGTYQRIDFEVHKVTNDEEDAAFRAAHPDFVGLSIRVRGTFNGSAFEYVTDLDVEQELTLSPPLVVDEAVSTNVTIRVDLATWFRNAAGTLVDPDTGNKGKPNESIIKNNIQKSFQAFEDEDGDGDDSDEG
jgi:hypothetical protein